MNFDHMNTLNADGTAFDGRRGPVAFACAVILAGVLVGLFYLATIIFGGV